MNINFKKIARFYFIVKILFINSIERGEDDNIENFKQEI